MPAERMRIALSNASPAWGGLHQVTEVLARGFQERGHEVLLLCRPESRLEQRMRGIVPLSSILWGMDLSPVALWRVHGVLRRFRADVVLTLTKKDVRLTAPVARAMGVPVVVRHANDRPLRSGAYHRWLYGRLPWHHVANSEATRRTLLASAGWLSPERFSVIYNAVDPDDFAVPAARIGLPGRALTFGFIGRLEERKGTLDLAEAWPRVAAAHPDAWLVMVGAGEMEAELRRRLAGRPEVHWLGLRSDVPAVLQALDVVVMPSHWEGFGLVALEAMVAGRPVVATRVSSLPEIVRDGVDGLLVEPRSPEQLASALIELGGSAEMRTRMGAAGRARAQQEFSVVRMLNAYEDLLRRASRAVS